MAITGRLGCGTYRLFIRGRCGEKQRGSIETFQSLAWGRVQDDTSTAEVQVSLTGDDGETCCELLSQVRSWHDNLTIFRDPGGLVWEGPLVELEYHRDTAIIRARDVSAWLDVRLVAPAIDHTTETGDGPRDLTQIAREVISSSFARDEPCVEVDYENTGIAGARKIDAWSTYAGDALRDLARTGLDFTVLGRRIIVGLTTDGGRDPIGPLSEEHFKADLAVIEKGLEAGNFWYVEGNDAAVHGSYGGPDPYFGLQEQRAKEDSIRDSGWATTDAVQRWHVTHHPPLYLVVPPDAQLAPEAPADIRRLIPGTLVNVDVRSLCRPVVAVQRLNSVSVTVTPEHEKVAVSLAPIGPTAADV